MSLARWFTSYPSSLSSPSPSSSPPARTCCVLAPEPSIPYVSPLVWDDVIHSRDNRAHLPVRASPHTRIAAQSDTRADVTPAELVKHFWWHLFIYQCNSSRAVHLVLKSESLWIILMLLFDARANELAGKVLHIWIIPSQRVALLGPLQTWGFLTALRINDDHTTGLALLM